MLGAAFTLGTGGRDALASPVATGLALSCH